MMIDSNEYQKVLDSDDYIICVPSGQVIDMKLKDVVTLKKINVIKFDVKAYKFVCDDKYVDNIYDFLNTYNKIYDKNQIEEFLLDCGLSRDHFRVFNDLSVDVYTHMDLSHKKLVKIPFKFNRITSNFDCSFNNLLTLENSPLTVHGYFNCSYNDLTNLKNGPYYVSKSYNCCYNKLTSLAGSPIRVDYFNCSYNNLKNLNDAPKTAHLTYLHNPIEK